MSWSFMMIMTLIRDSTKKKKKKIFRPSHPYFFGHVTGNIHTFLFGLISIYIVSIFILCYSIYLFVLIFYVMFTYLYLNWCLILSNLYLFIYLFSIDNCYSVICVNLYDRYLVIGLLHFRFWLKFFPPYIQHAYSSLTNNILWLFDSFW